MSINEQQLFEWAAEYGMATDKYLYAEHLQDSLEARGLLEGLTVGAFEYLLEQIAAANGLLED